MTKEENKEVYMKTVYKRATNLANFYDWYQNSSYYDKSIKLKTLLREYRKENA